MRTTKKAEVIQEEQDEYLDFVLGGPGGFPKKQTGAAYKELSKKSNTKKKRRNTQTSLSPEPQENSNSIEKPKIKKEKTLKVEK